MVTQGAQEAMVVLLLGLFDPARGRAAGQRPDLHRHHGPGGDRRDRDAAGRRPASRDSGSAPCGRRSPRRARAAKAAGVLRRAGLQQSAGHPDAAGGPPRSCSTLLRDEEVLLFEDNPYGMFVFDGAPLPTLKALDEHGVVIYLGSFSKTLYPGPPRSATWWPARR